MQDSTSLYYKLFVSQLFSYHSSVNFGHQTKILTPNHPTIVALQSSRF